VNLMKKRVRDWVPTIITYVVLIFSHIIYSSIFNVVREGGCVFAGHLCSGLSYKHLVSRSMHFPHAFISGKLHIILLWVPSQALELGAVRKLIP